MGDFIRIAGPSNMTDLYSSLLISAGLIGYRYMSPGASGPLSYTIGELVGISAAFALYSMYNNSGSTADASQSAMKGAELGIAALVGLSVANMSGMMPYGNSYVMFAANVGAIFVSLKVYYYIKSMNL